MVTFFVLRLSKTLEFNELSPNRYLLH